MQYSSCPNCNTPIKSGLLSSVNILDQSKTDLINLFNENVAEAYCSKCGNQLYDYSKYQLSQRKKNLTSEVQRLLYSMPIVTTHTPQNWQYEALNIVSGQSTTGTGVISEFTSAFTDLVGAQSSRYNKKLKEGEILCLQQMKMQTLSLGGNAIIACDLDYNELGSSKGMIMVCAAGTAVKLENIEVLKERKEDLLCLITMYSELINLEKYSIDE